MADEKNISIDPSINNQSLSCEYPPTDEPPYSECARTAKRPLSWLFWVPGLSDSNDQAIDRENLNLAHEHIIFDQSKDNIGFGPHGLFSEDTDKFNYRYDETCYDGSRMRKLLAAIDYKKPYDFIKNNCQDFVSYVRSLYRER